MNKDDELALKQALDLIAHGYSVIRLSDSGEIEHVPFEEILNSASEDEARPLRKLDKRVN